MFSSVHSLCISGIQFELETLALRSSYWLRVMKTLGTKVTCPFKHSGRLHLPHLLSWNLCIKDVAFYPASKGFLCFCIFLSRNK